MPQADLIACIDCGIIRKVQIIKGKPVSKRCRRCNAKRIAKEARRHPEWRPGRPQKLGRIFLQRGYRLIKLEQDDFFYPMTNNRGFVRENRLVIAQHLGRNLHQWEVVHHKNGIKTDNRIENLELNTIDSHNTITGMQNRIDALLRENEQLKRELANLKNQK
jgi:hypothetical protein